MANNSQGTVVTFGTATLGELVSVSVDGLQSDSVELTARTQASRVKSYSPADIDQGTVSVTCRGTTLMSTASVGLTASLSITGAGISFSFTKAIYERLAWSASVGELQVFTVTFKVGS